MAGFIDREEEMNTLERELVSVKEKGCSVVFIKGEAGTGKTRLINEFRSRVLDKGFYFLKGSSYFDSSEPYQPFKEAFEEYMEEPSIDEDKKSGLASMGFDSAPKVKEKRMFDSHRQATFSESTSEVRKIASRKGLVIFLDNLQWADKASLELFHYMSANLGEKPVLFVGAYRIEDVSGDHILREIQRRMSREHLYSEIELGYLDKEGSMAICREIIGREDVPDRFLELMYEKSEGNPLFLEECIEQMLEEGTINPDEDEYPTSETDVSIPNIIDDVIAKRVDNLDKDTKKVLRTGAVIGEEIPFSLLTECCEMDEMSVLEHIDILIDSNLWEEKAGEEKFAYTSGLIHLAVYDRMDEQSKREMHERTAEKMETIYSDELEEHYSDLSYHFEKGEDQGKAAEYYFRSGVKAKDVYAYEDSIDMFNKALGLLKDAEKKYIEEAELYEELGDSHQTIGEAKKGREFLEKALDKVEDLETKQRICRKIGETHFTQGKYVKSLDSIEKGLSLQVEKGLSYSQGTEELCKLLNDKGWIFMQRGEYSQAAQVFNEEKEVSENIENDGEIALAFHNLGCVASRKAEFEEAIDHLERAVELRNKIGQERELADSFNQLGTVYFYQGVLDKSLDYHKKAFEIAKRLGDKTKISSTLLNIALIFREKNKLDKAKDYLKRAFQMAKNIDHKENIVSSLIQLGDICRWEGDVDKASNFHQKADLIASNIGLKEGKIYSLCRLAEDNIECDQIEEALEMAKKAEAMMDEIASPALEYRIQTVMGICYRENKDYEKAAELFREAITKARKRGERQKEGRLLYELSLLWMKQGEIDRAKKSLQKTKERAEELGTTLWAYRAEYLLGELS